MTFPLVFPSGVADGQTIFADEYEQLDVDHSKAINGVDGDVAAGALEFSDCDLTGTSSINISGPIETTDDVTAENVTATATLNTDELFASGAASFGSTVEVSGVLTVLDAVVVSSGTERIEADRIIVNRVLCESPGTQTIDTATATTLAVNFIADDTWVITLLNGADPTAAAVLSTVGAFTDTNGTAHLQLKPGSKVSILFKAGAGQVGGIGLHPNVFPASVIGLSPAELAGPQHGANDWMRVDLVNIGTAATPKYSATLTMGTTP